MALMLQNALLGFLSLCCMFQLAQSFHSS